MNASRLWLVSVNVADSAANIRVLIPVYLMLSFKSMGGLLVESVIPSELWLCWFYYFIILIFFPNDPT